MEFLVQQEHLSKALEKAAQTNGHEDAVTILGYQVSSRLGDDHTSNTADVVAVQVDYEYRAAKRHRSFIFKVPFNHPHYEIIRKLGMYHTENTMYATVLPKLNALLQQPISPECYLLANHDTLVLENLTARGYRNGPTKLDFDHCVVLLKTVAKFQAASYKVGQLDRTLLTVVPQKQLYQIGAMAVMNDKLCSLYERLMHEEGIEASSAEKLRALNSELNASSTDAEATTDVFDFEVLNHGSLKSANVMFRYDLQGRRSVSARFVDF